MKSIHEFAKMYSIHTSILQHLVIEELSEAIPHFHNQLEKVTLHISRLNRTIRSSSSQSGRVIRADFPSFKKSILSLDCEERLLHTRLEDILLSERHLFQLINLFFLSNCSSLSPQNDLFLDNSPTSSLSISKISFISLLLGPILKLRSI